MPVLLTESLLFALIILFSYFIGAIPFGWLLARMYGIDITAHGSQKIGFTNVWRVMGLKYAIPILILDVMKGIAVACLLINVQVELPHVLTTVLKVVITLAVLVGHSWSFPLKLFTQKWHGGRSVATALGVAVVICYKCVLIGLFGLLFVVITRYVSLGVLISILLVSGISIFFWTTGQLPYDSFFVIISSAIFLYFRHLENIRRLISGTERKIGEKVIVK